MKTTDQIAPTYNERAVKLSNKAKTALLEGVTRDWEKAKQIVGDASKLEIQALNYLRAAGIKLQEACGHEQISFEFHRSIQDEIPKSLHFNAAKFCIHLARKFEQPVETLDEVRSARQMMFEQLGESRAPRRLIPQNSHERNVWSDFVNTTASLTSLFTELEEEPMEGWDRERLSSFVKTTEPIVERHRKAAVLLEESGVKA